MSEQAQDTPAERGWFWPDEVRGILAEMYQRHGYILFTSQIAIAVGDVLNGETFDAEMDKKTRQAGALLAAQRKNKRGGRKPTCNCLTCKKCKDRLYRRALRAL